MSMKHRAINSASDDYENTEIGKYSSHVRDIRITDDPQL